MSRLRFFARAGLALALFPALLVSLTAGDARAKSSRGSQKEKLLELWADHPDYVDRIRDGKDPRQQPSLKHAVQPIAPAVPLGPSETVAIKISLVVSAAGDVEAARVMESSDARFNEAALAAITQWTFEPAQGETGPIKAFAVAPIDFVGRPGSLSLNLALGPLTREMRGGTIGMRINIVGPHASAVKSGRVVITSARDDTGADLQVTGVSSSFRRTAVGRTSDEELRQLAPPSLNFSLKSPAASATKVASVEGVVELVVPEADPAATARIEQVAAHANQRLESPVLAAAGVTLMLFTHLSPREGPHEFDQGPLFGDPPPGMPSQMRAHFAEQLTDSDLAFGIADPEGRLVAMEFQTARGEPIEYDHNGWYHSGNTPGKSFSVYRLRSPLPADARLVCWLATPKSLIKTPLKLADLALPK